jgi:hypothetical protein
MVTREELYALVWSIPMTKVADQFGVSGMSNSVQNFPD